MIPLVSSLSYGPLNMCQLPRLWWKASLKAAGLLAEDYPECTGFLDEMVLERCGLEVQVTLEHFVENHGDDVYRGMMQLKHRVLRVFALAIAACTVVAIVLVYHLL